MYVKMTTYLIKKILLVFILKSQNLEVIKIIKFNIKGGILCTMKMKVLN